MIIIIENTYLPVFCGYFQGNPPPLFLAVEEYVRESNVEKRKKRREIVELLLPQLNIQLHSSYKVCYVIM